MKKVFVSALVCGVMLTGCGGGGSAPKSGVKNNEYLGSLSALFVDHDFFDFAQKNPDLSIFFHFATNYFCRNFFYNFNNF